jgi:succinate-acetate transporter protein
MSVVGDPFRASRASIQFRSSVYRDVEAQLNRNAVSEPVLVGEPEAVVTQSQFGDPGPLGLSAFALTTSVLSLINIQARGVTDPNIAVGLGRT